LEIRLRSAQGCKPASDLASDQRFESGSDERCLFLDSRQAPSFIYQAVVNV